MGADIKTRFDGVREQGVDVAQTGAENVVALGRQSLARGTTRRCVYNGTRSSSLGGDDGAVLNVFERRRECTVR